MARGLRARVVPVGNESASRRSLPCAERRFVPMRHRVKLYPLDTALFPPGAELRATFFLPAGADLDRLRHLDPDRDVSEFATGQRAWILQTYARLAAAGHP